MGDRSAGLAERIRGACRGPNAVVAVDGRAGAGKSALAAALARRLDGASVVPTDDFACWADPFGWWERMLTEVVEPLAAGQEFRYQRRDFASGAMTEG